MITLKTKQQIADEYGICTQTLRRWLAQVGIKIGRGLVSPTVQNQITNVILNKGESSNGSKSNEM